MSHLFVSFLWLSFLWLTPVLSSAQNRQTVARVVVGSTIGPTGISAAPVQAVISTSDGLPIVDYWSQLVYQLYDATGIKTPAVDDKRISVVGGELVLGGGVTAVRVYDMKGAMVFAGRSARIPLSKGIYVVDAGGQRTKVYIGSRGGM